MLVPWPYLNGDDLNGFTRSVDFVTYFMAVFPISQRDLPHNEMPHQNEYISVIKCHGNDIQIYIEVISD